MLTTLQSWFGSRIHDIYRQACSVDQATYGVQLTYLTPWMKLLVTVVGECICNFDIDRLGEVNRRVKRLPGCKSDSKANKMLATTHNWTIYLSNATDTCSIPLSLVSEESDRSIVDILLQKVVSLLWLRLKCHKIHSIMVFQLQIWITQGKIRQMSTSRQLDSPICL